MARFFHEKLKHVIHARDVLSEEPSLSFRKTIRKRPTAERIFDFWQVEIRKIPSKGKYYFQWLTQGFTGSFTVGSNMVENIRTNTLTASATNGSQQFALMLQTGAGRKLSDWEGSMRRAAGNVEKGHWPYITVAKKSHEQGLTISKFEGVDMEFGYKRTSGEPNVMIKGELQLKSEPPSNITLTEQGGLIQIDCSTKMNNNWEFGMGTKTVDEQNGDIVHQRHVVHANAVWKKNDDFNIEIKGDTMKVWNIGMNYKQVVFTVRGTGKERNDYGFVMKF